MTEARNRERPPLLRRAVNALASRHPALIEARIRDAIRRNLPREMRRHGVPGVQIAFAVDERPIVRMSLGLADALRGVPLTDGTRFRSASLSKPVAALVVLRLARHGAVDLDRPLDALFHELPGFSGQSRETLAKITLRRLICHTAGLAPVHPPTLGPAEPGVSLGALLRSDVRAAQVCRLEREPGAGCVYSGAGYALLEHAVSALTGREFADLGDELVFRAMGLRDSFVETPTRPAGDLAAEHAEDGAVLEPRRVVAAAASGLVTTATDMVEFARTLVRCARGEGGPLEADVAALSLTRGEGSDSKFTHGWHLRKNRDESTLDAGGARPGFRGLVQFTARRGIAGAGLANGERGLEVLKPVFGLLYELGNARA